MKKEYSSNLFMRDQSKSWISAFFISLSVNTAFWLVGGFSCLICQPVWFHFTNFHIQAPLLVHSLGLKLTNLVFLNSILGFFARVRWWSSQLLHLLFVTLHQSVIKIQLDVEVGHAGGTASYPTFLRPPYLIGSCPYRPSC